MSNLVAVTIIAQLLLACLFIVGVVMIVDVGGIVIEAWREREKKPKREKRSLKCLAGMHEWRYVKLPSRSIPGLSYCSYRPKKVFTTSYYNKKVSFVIKYCLKCLKFEAEKI